MEIKTVSGRCVAIVIHGGISSPEEAAALVRAALALRGLESWERMELDLFPAGGDALIVARPVRGAELHITPAPWLLPFLSSEQ